MKDNDSAGKDQVSAKTEDQVSAKTRGRTRPGLLKVPKKEARTYESRMKGWINRQGPSGQPRPPGPPVKCPELPEVVLKTPDPPPPADSNL